MWYVHNTYLHAWGNHLLFPLSLHDSFPLPSSLSLQVALVQYAATCVSGKSGQHGVAEVGLGIEALKAGVTLWSQGDSVFTCCWTMCDLWHEQHNQVLHHPGYAVT